MEASPSPLSSREPVTFSVLSRFLYPNRYFSIPSKRRHPERSASQIYRITEGFMARSRRTPTMLAGKCSSELSGHRLQGKSNSHSLPSEAEGSAVLQAHPGNVFFDRVLMQIEDDNSYFGRVN